MYILVYIYTHTRTQVIAVQIAAVEANEGKDDGDMLADGGARSTVSSVLSTQLPY